MASKIGCKSCGELAMVRVASGTAAVRAANHISLLPIRAQPLRIRRPHDADDGARKCGGDMARPGIATHVGGTAFQHGGQADDTAVLALDLPTT